RSGITVPTFVTDHTGKEMLGRSVPDYLRDPPERFAASRKDAVLRPTVRAAGGPLVLVGPDGKTYHVIVGPLRSGPHLFGELEMLASALDTMSDRVRNILELEQQRLRDVPHELRSPLARLQLALSLARSQENSGVERHLSRIACEADRLEELIARTLKLARL